jgi:rhamnogalacturonan endolyase
MIKLHPVFPFICLLTSIACVNSIFALPTPLEASQDVHRYVDSIGSEGTAQDRVDFLICRSYEPGGSTVREHGAYIQFDLTSFTAISNTGHSLTLHVVNGMTWGTNQVDVFALNTNAGYTVQNWDENTISFGTASDEFDATLVDGVVDNDRRYPDADYLGSLPARPSTNDPASITFSSALLDNLITNRFANGGLLTLIIANRPGVNREIYFDSREGTNPNVSTLMIQGDQPAPPVVLTDNGSTVSLDNGRISAIFTKSNGECTTLTHAGKNLLANGGRLYLDSNSGGNYYAFSGSYTVVEALANRVHIRFSGTMGQLDASLHYIMQSGENGFHSYVLFSHGPGLGATYLEQTRAVLRCDPATYVHAFSSMDKTGQMIAPSVLSAAPTIMDATHQLPAISSYTNETGTTEDGFPVYSKYDWADVMENHKVHGLASDTRGLWMISGSEEYFNGGPSHAELLVHGTDTTPLMIKTFHSSHFLYNSLVNVGADEVWSKVYGPYFIYANTGTSASDVWQDAQQQADQEKQAWPPSWMNEPGFPLARGTVGGTFRVNGNAISNALVVLGDPGLDWQIQGSNYLFWTRTDGNGDFLIPKIRPGTYSAYIVAPGFSKQCEVTGVVVAASTTNDLGVLDWKPETAEETLWMIGTPDRSTEGFQYSERMRQYGLWWRYLEDQGTNDLVYTIGSSVETNWYYALSTIPLDGGTYHAPFWHIDFDVATIPEGPARLILDLAGARSSTLTVSLNGSTITNLSIPNDAGLYRSAVLGSMYRHHSLEFGTNLFLQGTNRMTFTLNGGTWSSSKPALPNSGVMWDSLRLEAGPVMAENLNVDSDRDQINDDWEILYFGNLNGTSGDPGEDFDQDGFIDVDEYFAGTNPTNGGSLLEISSLSLPEGTNYVVSWQSVSNVVYEISISTNLTQPMWLPLAIEIQATPPINVHTSAIPNAAHHYLRVRAKKVGF